MYFSFFYSSQKIYTRSALAEEAEQLLVEWGQLTIKDKDTKPKRMLKVIKALK